MISSSFPKDINIISEKMNTNKLSWLDEEKNLYNITLDSSINILSTIINKINNTKIINTNYYFYLKKYTMKIIFSV